MSVARVSVGRRFGLLAAAASLVILSTSSATARADESGAEVDELIERIISLRGEVEALDSELTRLKDEHQRRMTSLSRRHADLELERGRAQRDVDRREKRVAEARDGLDETGGAGDELVPVLKAAIAGAREHVRAGLPFKRSARLEALDELETQLELGSIDPARAANRLWAFHEDELRLVRETGLFRQVVEIDGEERLVDVVRLGMMMMLFRGDDELYGYAEHRGGRWAFRKTGDHAVQQRIDALIDAMRKQIRTGLFQIPITLAVPEIN